MTILAESWTKAATAGQQYLRPGLVGVHPAILAGMIYTLLLTVAGRITSPAIKHVTRGPKGGREMSLEGPSLGFPD